MLFNCKRRALALGLAAIAVTQNPTVAASGYLQCVPFARSESGIDIRGNASGWWHQAAGKYARGQKPVVGAVLAMPGTRAMPGGHVAVVSRIVSDREILITHANWSPIGGRRGQIERNVRAVDVSAANDWRAVRIWYAPIRDLGLRASPAYGFIYSSSDNRSGNFADRPATDRPPQFDDGWAPGNDLGAIVATLASNG